MKEAENKAKELIEKYSVQVLEQWNSVDWRRGIAKDCALICCDEIIAAQPTETNTQGYKVSKTEYWLAVKESINKY